MLSKARSPAGLLRPLATRIGANSRRGPALQAAATPPTNNTNNNAIAVVDGPILISVRTFAGRSSKKPPWTTGEYGQEGAEDVLQSAKEEELKKASETSGTAAAGSTSPGATTQASSSDSTAGGKATTTTSTKTASSSTTSTSASSTSSSRAGGARPLGGPDPTPGGALFCLPLFRRPAFPGFYQIVQVSDQEVLDFLFTLRKGGNGDFLAGFMTKEAPSSSLLSDDPSGAGSSASAAAYGNLRRDGGRAASVAELEEVGSMLQVINLTQYPNIAGGQVVVMPHKRIRRTKTVSEPSPNIQLAAVTVEDFPEPEVKEDDAEVTELAKKASDKMKELLETSTQYKEQFEQVIRFYDLEHPVKVADLIAGMSLARREELQEILMEQDLKKRLEKVVDIVSKDLEFAKLQLKMKSEAEDSVVKEQRREMLMQQMKTVMEELGLGEDEKHTSINQFRDALKDKIVPAEAEKVIENELAKLGTLEPTSSEFNVCRTYLEWLTCLPWGIHTPENKDIKRAEEILNEDHYGLEDVKERILEHIAVSFLKNSTQGKIMCLAGPPGVGKTSIGSSIARALDRKFYRFSVGGMHDVAELRGHRRTYVGAMPGKLIQCLKITQSSNPVVLIDEIDKLGRDYRGDPSSAFLEILDPEQNANFRDHYLDVPVDLSNVLFICTANVTDTIPGPLLDRMEVIRIAGYVFEEKVAIANQYLIPQTEEQSGIGKDNMVLHEEALNKIIADYAREAGVRHLRKLLEKINRKVALRMVRKKEGDDGKTEIQLGNLPDFIGQPPHMSDRLYDAGAPPGVVMGLAWTQMGGASLYVEATGHGGAKVRTPNIEVIANESPSDPILDPETEQRPVKKPTKSFGGGMGGSMKITGQLGEVMSESSAISLTYARLFLMELEPDNTYFDETAIHLNVPEGAVPKDGPSAGMTMATSLMSLALNVPVKPDLAMTGELTLSGKVLKVGGIKEKVIAAKREGVTTLLLPRQNEADYSELKDYLKAGLTTHFIDHFDDTYRLAFDQSLVPPINWPSRGLPVVTVETPADVLPPPMMRAKPGDSAGKQEEVVLPPPISSPSSPSVSL